MSFIEIAAIGKNRELGKDGKLVFSIPDDMKFFRERTMGHAVLMGRKTFESLPGGGLKGRKNYVVTTKKSLENSSEDAERPVLVNSLSEFVKEHQDDPEEIYVIGGGMVYWEMMKHADELLLTEVEAEVEADTFFPEFDKSKYERKVLGSGEQDGVKYEFVSYKKIKEEK